MRVMVNTVIVFSLSFIIYIRHHLSNAVSHSTSLWFESNDVPGEELRKLNIANIQFSCNDLIRLTAILIWNLDLRAKIDYTIIYRNSHVGTQRRLEFQKTRPTPLSRCHSSGLTTFDFLWLTFELQSLRKKYLNEMIILLHQKWKLTLVFGRIYSQTLVLKCTYIHMLKATMLIGTYWTYKWPRC
jgi:hypothetical protein